MPPKKGPPTPNKPPENPNWTLDEGEEMRRDINNLQKKTLTKDELQEMRDSIEAKLDTKMDSMKAQLDTKMDSMKDQLDTKMDSMEFKMDGLKGEIMEVLRNFIIEKTPKSENASHEIHDEDTRKVNQEC
jgi:uncharacterized protein YggL (DUF469 family)